MMGARGGRTEEVMGFSVEGGTRGALTSGSCLSVHTGQLCETPRHAAQHTHVSEFAAVLTRRARPPDGVTGGTVRKWPAQTWLHGD